MSSAEPAAMLNGAITVPSHSPITVKHSSLSATIVVQNVRHTLHVRSVAVKQSVFLA